MTIQQTVQQPLSSLVQPVFDAHCLDGRVDVPALTRQIELALAERVPSLQQIPCLNEVPCSNLPDKSLARFRCMVQDNGCQNEIYAVSAAAVDGQGSRRWLTTIFQDLVDIGDAQVDQKSIQFADKYPFYASTITGESPWVRECSATKVGAEEQLAERLAALSTENPTERLLLKCYNNVGWKLNDALEVVGILEKRDEDSAPCLHVISHRLLQTSACHPQFHSVTVQADGVLVEVRQQNDQVFAAALKEVQVTVEQLRTELINWIANEALLGDTLAAEFLLYNLMSRIYSRIGGSAIGSLSLTLNKFPIGSAHAHTLANVLQLLVPSVSTLSLTVANLNSGPFTPTIKYDPADDCNHVQAGCQLQLPDGHSLIVDETAMETGTLTETGVRNLAALQQLLTMHAQEYPMVTEGESSATCAVTTECSLNILVLSEGLKSMAATDKTTSKTALFPTDLSIPLQPINAADTGNKDIEVHPLLPLFRLYIAFVRGAGSMSHQYAIPDAVADLVAADFVESRKAGAAGTTPITEADLYMRLNLARYNLLSRGEYQLDVAAWNHAKQLEEMRAARLTAPVTTEQVGM